ncbi:hypothetical protein JAAARDRAFT_35035 [Jaapia argillacea MUCL 33604]|uniref:Uncharacterized protein n=1 Tax=Jaapia argillacea MUCL 33604 TaxID=933084 RepID=A0A067PU02_9AGAM|nr:hypothetical protein JAAARDRAFT_35035 [Jaapia argillacea MUCL 33604]
MRTQLRSFPSPDNMKAPKLVHKAFERKECEASSSARTIITPRPARSGDESGLEVSSVSSRGHHRGYKPPPTPLSNASVHSSPISPNTSPPTDTEP